MKEIKTETQTDRQTNKHGRTVAFPCLLIPRLLFVSGVGDWEGLLSGAVMCKASGP